MQLTIGPNPFFWDAATVRGFYQGLAAAPVSRVVLGELVCSKRLPFWQNEIAPAAECLIAAGKDVAITSLALVTLKRERKATDALTEIGLPIEVNDLTALHALPPGQPFWVGPLINVYNEGSTLNFTASASDNPAMVGWRKGSASRVPPACARNSHISAATPSRGTPAPS